ncbi:MAG: N-acetylmuramoyl-L-alanine amidase [Bacteroidota bacterium]
MPLSSLFRVLLLVGLVVAPAVPAAAAAAEVDIERISFHRRADGKGYVIRLHTNARVGAFSVDETEAGVELVVFRAHVDDDFVRDAASGPVRSYRVESGEDRVTFRFETRAEVSAQAYPDRASTDLLLSLTTVTARPAPPVVSTSTSTPVGGGTTNTPVGGGTTNWRLDTIVLDAGHGGADYGAVANGTSDKEVALAVVLRLGAMIENELSVNVVYTRTRDDQFHSLRERGRIANREGGKLFISVHANAASSSRAHGTETFFLAPHRSESARQVMERENSVIELESDPSLYADFDDEGGILRALAMSAYQEESQLLATLVEREFVASGRHSRGVKQAPFLVLWAASMPAVLVETGFITNREEARFLASTDGQERTARAIFRAVKAYKEKYERGLRLASTG